MGESSLWWLTTSHCWLFCAQKLSYLHLQRWAIALSEYDYEIDYRCSEKHSICDALSRLFREESKLDSESESYSIRAIEKDFPLTAKDIGKATLLHPVLSKVLDGVMMGWLYFH